LLSAANTARRGERLIEESGRRIDAAKGALDLAALRWLATWA